MTQMLHTIPTDAVAMPAAEELANTLRAFEQAIDDSFALGGRLAALLPAARSEARLSAVVGQGVFDRVCQALTAMGEARGHAVAGHRLLDKINQQVGYVVAYGDEQPKPGDDNYGRASASIVPIRDAA